MGVNIRGYYVDPGIEKTEAKAKDVFVVFTNTNGREEWLEYYCPVGQHHQLDDVAYLKECTEISKGDYIELTSGYYTPENYIQ